MTLNKALITPSESDLILSLESEWLALSDAVKIHHIERASIYIQGNYSCLLVDWSDDSTITDNVKDACGYFALADFNGNLYSDIKQTVKGEVIEESKTLGPLKKTIKYDPNSSTYLNFPLSYPNSLMLYSCSKINVSTGGFVKAIRV